MNKKIFGGRPGFFEFKSDSNLKQMKINSVCIAKELYELYQKYDKAYFKDKDKQEIVSAGNFFVKEEFTLRSLDKIFKNKMYDVNQLINLVENNRNNELKIEFYPKNWNALSNFEYTINVD